MSTAAASSEPFPVPPGSISVAEYHRLIDVGALAENNRIELLKGVLVEKVDRDPLHAALVGIIHGLIDAVLPPGFHTRGQVPITLADSEPEPDVAIVRGDETDYLGRHPEPADVCLVIEISVSSLLTDRYKGEIYAEAGLASYWIVDGVSRQVECYSQPESTAAGFRYSDCQRFGLGDSVPVIIDGREIGKLAAAQLLPVVP